MAANDEILGISGHLDIGDIEKAFNELINNLDKIGIKTDSLSRKMTDSMNEIAKSTDDTATKQKRAMEVLASGMEEAKRALINYPEQLRLAKNEADQTATATARLETELGKLNTKFSEAVIGSKTYDELKTKIAGVQQQIENNNALHQQQLTSIQQMEAGYNGLVSIYGAANVATTANAVAHGATAVAVGVEAVQHGVNATEIGKEAEATKKAAEMSIEAKNANDGWLQSEKEVLDYLKQREEEYVKLRDSGEEYQKVLAAQSSLISTIQAYGKNVSDYDTALKAGEQQKKVQQQITEAVKQTTTEQKEHKKSVVEIESELQKAQEEYRKMIGLSEDAGRIRTAIQENIVASQYNQGIISEGELTKILEAKNRIEQLKEELSNAKNEAKQIAENTAGDNAKSSFKEQWNAVNELHSKLQSLSKELKDYETEYDRMAEKPGFDPQSKKAQELSDKIADLRKQISETKQEMDSETATPGGFLARWKNAIVDVMTGNGKFQESLGSMKSALGGLLGPFTAATSGALAFGRALLSLIATPIGAALAAIVLALKGIHEWFTKSADGQRVFAKISAYVSSLLSSLTDIGVKLGRYLYNAFAQPQSSMKAFGVSLISLVIEPLKVLANLIGVVTNAFGLLGNITKAVMSEDWDNFHKYWDAAKNNWSKMGDAFEKAGEATANSVVAAYNTAVNGFNALKMVGSDVIDNLGELNIAGWIDDTMKKARESADLAGKETEANIALSQAKMKEKQLDIDIAREREKIYMLTGKEKDAQIEKVKNMLKEKYEPQIAAQQTLLDIQRQRNKLHTVSLEQLAKEREAQGAVYAIQAQQASSTRMLVRMQQANLRSMANAGKRDAKQQQAIEEADANIQKVIEKNAYTRAKAQQDMEQKIVDAKIAAMREGTEKVLAERNRALERELEEIEEQRQARIKAEIDAQRAEYETQAKAIRARGGNPKEWSDKEKDQSAIDAINAQYETLKNFIVQRQINDQRQQELQSMRDYLKEYGSLEQQRLAITEEYAEKIQKALNPAEKAALTMQRDEELKQKSSNQLLESIDWVGIFNNLEGHTKEYLEGLRNQLETVLSSGSLKVDEMARVQEKIRDINAALSEQGGFFSTISPLQVEYNRRLQEEADAKERLEAAKTQQSQIEAERTGIELALRSLLGDSSANITLQTANPFKEGTKENQRFNALIEQLTVNEGKLAQARKQTAKATKDAEQAEDGSKTTLKGKWAETRETIENSKIYGNISGVPDLLNGLGLGEAAEKAQKGLDGFNDGMNAVTKFMEGDYIGALTSGISAVTNFGEALGSWSSSNRAEVEAKNERLQNSIDVNTNAINRLTDAMKNASPEEAFKLYEQAVAVMRSNEQAERQQMVNNAFMYDGGSSLASAMGGGNGVVKDIFNYLRSKGVNTGAKYEEGIGDLLDNLSAENWSMLYADEYGRKLLERLGNAIASAEDEGNYNGLFGDILEFANSYNKEAYDELQRQYDELQRQFQENITGVSFDSFKDKFKSSLMDMKKDAKSFSDDFTEMLTSSILDARMEELYGRELEELYDKWSKAFDNGITESEVKELQQMQDELAKRMMATRDEIAAMTGYDRASQDQQSATFNSAQNITYEQADAITGILTAQLITQEQDLSQSVEQTLLLTMMQVDVRGISEGVNTMVETQNSMNNHLAAIELNTDVLPDMAEEIVKIRKKMDEQ